MKVTSFVMALTCAIYSAASAATIDLETPSLGVATHREDWSATSGFSSNGAFFNNTFDQGSWAGFALSRETDTTTPGFGNQYSARPGSGFGGSAQYAIGFADYFNNTLPTITLPSGQRPVSVQVTNTTYAALSMRDGDSFAKKFGGTSGNDPDFFKLTIRAFDLGNAPTGTIDFFLADYRFANNSLDYIASTWQSVDLSLLPATTATLKFDFSSSDNGMFGINTPTYVAVDQLVTVVPEPSTTAMGAACLFMFALRRLRVRRAGAMLGAVVISGSSAFAGIYAPAAGQSGSTAIAAGDSRIIEWANTVVNLTRGPQNIANPGGPLATFGTASAALGAANNSLVSLGDGGSITLGFPLPIGNKPGFDFAVFENGFASAGLAYLELGFVEVSSNGTNFFRFPSISTTQTATQVATFGLLDATDLHNLAGKYVAGFGTPFDLSDLVGVSALLDVNDVRYVRVVDVVGSINPSYGTTDSFGNFVNDPYATAFSSSGFDFDAVGVLSAVPEPGTAAFGLVVIVASFTRRRRSA